MDEQERERVREHLREIGPVLDEFLQETIGYRVDFTLMVWGEENGNENHPGLFISSVKRPKLRRLITRMARELAERAASALVFRAPSRPQ